MEIKDTKILELIFKSKKSIEKLNKTSNDRKEIKKLANEILKRVEKIDIELKEEESNLEIYLDELRKLEKEETLASTINILNILVSNLPKDVVNKVAEKENELNLYSVKIPKGKSKSTEILVGTITINTSDELDDINIVVTIGDNSQEFNISKINPLRIYKVISYIHDNLSYDE